ncbi:hypothetical protein [Cypionkella sp.]|uniref:hypothetical protein n=1 Tax=Cypionkella sp. TaxID=2811411 RepID=UPI002AC9CF15|nr:hypothetical protein [Cypionkella sp.]
MYRGIDCFANTTNGGLSHHDFPAMAARKKSTCSAKAANVAELRGKSDKFKAGLAEPLEIATQALYPYQQSAPESGANNTPDTKVWVFEAE